jgi:hypothetical protein
MRLHWHATQVLSLDVLVATADGAARTPQPSKDDPVIAIACHTASFGSSPLVAHAHTQPEVRVVSSGPAAA